MYQPAKTLFFSLQVSKIHHGKKQPKPPFFHVQNYPAISTSTRHGLDWAPTPTPGPGGSTRVWLFVLCDLWHLQTQVCLFVSSFLVVQTECWTWFKQCQCWTWRIHTEILNFWVGHWYFGGRTGSWYKPTTASTCWPHGMKPMSYQKMDINAMMSILGGMFSFHWVPNHANLLQTALSMHTGP